MSRAFQMNAIKASKIEFNFFGFYSNLKTDYRKLYYSISEIQIKAR